MIKFLLYLLFLIPIRFNGFNFLQVFLFYFLFIFITNFRITNQFFRLTYFFGVDGLRYFIIILRIWIRGLIFIARWKIYKNNIRSEMFSCLVLSLLLFLLLTFSSLNLLIFYIFFEVRLIPLLFLIMGWGYQPERLIAGFYIIFYTLFFSFPIILGLFYLYNNFSSFIILFFSVIDNYILYFLINIIFFVKIPLFVLHLWLPKAHVEAPIAGSIILAGVTLKLGGFGLIRFLKIFLTKYYELNIFFINLRLMGGFIISLICIFQTDIKILIAYSSISHMSLVLSSILTLNYRGFTGSLIIIISHGLCSSGLFCIANIYYERFYSRRIYVLKGLLNIMPRFRIFMFLLRSRNISAPPSLNLLGEIIILKSIISYRYIFHLILFLILFLGAVYSIYLYSFSNHGFYYSGYYRIQTGVLREYLLLFLHWFPLNILIVLSELFIVFCLCSLIKILICDFKDK